MATRSLLVVRRKGEAVVTDQPPLPRVGQLLHRGLPMTSRQPSVERRPNTSLPAIGRIWLQATTEVGVEFDSAAQLHPRFAQWRSPHGLLVGKSQSTSGTTIHLSEHMFPLWIIGRKPPVGVSGRSSRKLVSALGATGLQNGAARTGLHTMAKTMLLGTATVIWLESAFHARLLVSVPRGSRQLWTNNLLG